MKHEDRIISVLFERAREEAPKVSFEHIAEGLTQHLFATPSTTTGISSRIKQFLIQNMGLNSIILVIGAGLVYYSITEFNPKPESSGLALTEDSLKTASSILPIVPPLPTAKTVPSPAPALTNS